ncbi:MAG: hypothetical protein IJO93_02355 [Clostridia bacterium]|nr:hypothetical protein [Clostridia bacterium]
MENKYIYVMLSQTQTKFARCIRKVGKQKYNHAAIALDDSLSEIYAFARPQHNAIFLGRLVCESVERYTLRRGFPVPVVLLRIPVSEEEHAWIRTTIDTMLENPEYMYNLFSILTYPLFRGFATYKAFTCMEFVTYLLQHSGYLRDKLRFRYTPDELLCDFTPEVVYSGDIRGCLPDIRESDRYFAPVDMKIFLESIKSIFRITGRSLCRRKALMP